MEETPELEEAPPWLLELANQTDGIVDLRKCQKIEIEAQKFLNISDHIEGEIR